MRVKGHKLEAIERRPMQLGGPVSKLYTVRCECGWTEVLPTKKRAREEWRWHVRRVRERREFAAML